jgi:hypothetical protein
MELSAAQRKIVFGLVAFALAALAVYLIASRGSGSPAPQAAPSRHPSASAVPPTASAGPATAPPPASDASQSSDIYSLVPFTPQGLTSAETVAVRFGAAYGTYSYTESAAAYVATLKGYVSGQLGQQIAAAYSTPGVAGQRASQKQVSTATAKVTALRAFGATSLTFVLQVRQQITATASGGPTVTSYAVTLTGGDTTWQVTDVQLAAAGQF